MGISFIHNASAASSDCLCIFVASYLWEHSVDDYSSSNSISSSCCASQKVFFFPPHGGVQRSSSPTVGSPNESKHRDSRSDFFETAEEFLRKNRPFEIIQAADEMEDEMEMFVFSHCSSNVGIPYWDLCAKCCV